MFGKNVIYDGRSVKLTPEAEKRVYQKALLFIREAEKMASGEENNQDGDAIINELAAECMDAFEKKDHERLIDCLHAIIGDIMSKMSEE